MHLRCLWTLLIGFSNLAQIRIQSALPSEVTTFSQYYSLSSAEAQEGQSVRLIATVLYCDLAWGILFLHDGEQSSFVNPGDLKTAASSGQLVELTGKTTSIDGVMGLTNLALKVLGPGKSLEAKPVSIPDLGAQSGQWVEVSGQVRAAATNEGRLKLKIFERGKHCVVYVLDYPLDKDIRCLVDSRVRVRGVNASKVVDGRLDQATLFIPGLADITIEERPSKTPVELPVVSIGSVIRSDIGVRPSRLVHFQGTVVSARPGKTIVVAEDTGGIEARISQGDAIQANQRVDLWGFPVMQRNRVVLDDAFFVVLPVGTPAVQSMPPVSPSAKAMDNLEPLRLVRQVKSMSKSEVAQCYPVRLRGVLTYADPEWTNGFLQDETGAIYVRLASTHHVVSGHVVEIEGYTDPGLFAPLIIPTAMTVCGTTNLPAPARLRLEDLVGGKWDSHWVELEGVVHGLTDHWGHIYLEIASGRGNFRVLVPGLSINSLPTNLVDARVCVQGACAALLNPKNQLVGITLHTPSLAYVQVLEQPPADPFVITAKPIQEVTGFDPEQAAGRRVKVRGVVTFETPEKGFIIQDSTGAIRVHSQETNQVQPGDELEVLGFPLVGEFSPELHRSLIRKIGSAPPPSPKAIRAEDILKYGTSDAELVQIEAVLLETATRSAVPRLTVQDGPVIFTAVIEGGRGTRRIGPLESGSRLRLTGVCSLQADEWKTAKSFRILLRSPEDIQVLKRPPWWSLRHALYIVVSLAGLIAVTLAWIGLLRRRVSQQTETIRHRLEREAALEKRYEELIENANDVVYTVDLEGRFTSINRAGERLSGYSRAEVLALRVEDIAVPEIRPRIRQQLAERFQGQEIPPFEMQILTKTGRRVDLEVNNRMVFAHGQPVGFQGIARDITARKRAEEALRQAEQKYHSIFDNAVEGIFQKTREGCYLSLNPSLASMHGFRSPADMLEDEANLQSAQYMDFRRRLEYQRLLERDGAVTHFEYEILRRDGSRIWVSESTRAMGDSQGRLLYFEGSLVNITERRQLEEQYRQAQKMESVGQLAAGVAHDFNNLLTIIQGYTALILTSLPPSSEHADGLKQIAEASRRAANLTRQLLAFSRRQIMRPEVVKLNDVITNMTKMLHPMLGDDIALQFTYASGLPMVYADVSMLEQVLMNLAVNARDAMARGGRLLIQTEVRPIDSAYVLQNPEASPGQYVCMSVIDTGCGMDAATMGRLFEPFFTTKEVGKGSGLGLATVYGIVKQHKGWVEVASEVGCGSTFKVFLPTYAEILEEKAPPVAAPPVNIPGSETILLVEDEPALRGLTRRVLQKNGYRVIEAASGMEAESIWRRHNDRIDLLLTDIVMPEGMSGRDLAERLQSEDGELKVLYTSGYSRDIVGKDFMLQENVSFLPKPYRPGVLARAVRDCLEGRTAHYRS